MHKITNTRDRALRHVFEAAEDALPVLPLVHERVGGVRREVREHRIHLQGSVGERGSTDTRELLLVF